MPAPSGAAPAQQLEYVAIDALTPHPRNPRRGNVAVIGQSIVENGFYGACVVQRSTGHVIVGNHRLLAARQQGLSHVPVLWLDCSDEQATRILLADNRTNDLAGEDDALLAGLLRELADAGSLAGTGYDGVELAALMQRLARDDQALADMNDDTRRAAETVRRVS